MSDIHGSAQADTLFGTPGADTLSGGGSDDRLDGGAGDDVLSGGSDADTIHGESGDDVIDGGSGNDTMEDGAGDDVVHGGDGDDYVLSESGSDQLHGDGGHDSFTILRNHAGGTIFVSGGTGNDYLNLGSLAAGNVLTADLGEGVDEVYFSALAGSATLSLGSGSDIISGFSDFVGLATKGNPLRITDWEGGAEGDFLTVADLLARRTAWDGSTNPFSAGYLKLAQSGSDVILSFSAKADGIFAAIIVFEGIALAAFSAENFGGWSPDGTVDAGRHIVGDESVTELIRGGSGGDLIEGGDGRDIAHGGAGNDEIRGDGGNDRLVGGAGDDELHGGDGNDTLYGDSGDDIVHGGDGDDRIEDSAGAVDVYGEGGNDNIFVQRVTGTAPAAIHASGGDGHDTIGINVYNRSHVTVDAGAGDDVITLNGNEVSQTLTLGDGADVVNYRVTNYGAVSSAAAPLTRITDFQTGDSGDRLNVATIYTALGSDPFGSGFFRLVQQGADVLLQYDLNGPSPGYGWFTLISLANADASAFTAYNLGGFAPDSSIPTGLVLDGTAGNDRIHGDYGADAIQGNDGDDLVEGLGGDDELSGGAGADRLLGEAGVDHLLGGDGDDRLEGGNGDDLLDGGEGADTLLLGYGNDVAHGGAGNDRVTSSDDGNDTVHGGEGDDFLQVTRFLTGSDRIVLNGDSGNDQIWVSITANGSFQVDIDAGDGDDRVILESGFARLVTLGAGRDVLELGGGAPFDSSTVVTDFQAGEGGDRIDFDSWLHGFAQNLDPNANPFLTDSMRLVQSGADLLVRIDPDGAGGTFGWFTAVTLRNVDIAAIRPFNFDNYQLLHQHGTEAADNLDGSGLDDTLYGEGGDDSLRGFDGADTFHGGAGADSMVGGLGNDVYHVDDAGDTIEENPGEGTDEVRTSLAGYSLVGTNLENLTGTSGAAQDLRGNVGDNVITGGPGSDVLRLQDGGDDTVNGGAGSDNIFFIGSLTSADVVRGGSETDTLVLQGAYGTLALTANITEIENISLLGGGNTAFGEPGTNRHDYVLITHDMNFAAGLQVRINGAALLEGEDFTFDGSAETDARFVVFGGKGRDTLTGGLGHDIFFFAEDGRFATGDTVNGGAGYDGMFLRGNYTIDFNAPGYTGLFTNIENLTLTSATDERYARGGGTEFDYDLTLSNAIVKPGETLTVSGALLMATETMILDAGQELDGLLRLFGGRASDTLKGGANADLLHGNLGADSLTGNGGADTFRFDSAADSDGLNMDRILDFTPGTDRIDLGRIDANSNAAGDQAFAWIGTNAFSGSAGELRARQDGTSWFVEGDTDGDGAADLVIALTLHGPAPLGAGDFIF